MSESPASAEDRLRRIVSHYPFGAMVVFDTDLRIVLARGEGLRDVGLNGAEMEGKTIWEIFGPTADVIEAQYRAALRGETVEQVVPYKERVYRTSAGPIVDETGAVDYGIVITQDVTTEKAVEADLQLFKASVEQSTESILITDTAVDVPGPRIVYANPAFERMSGYRLDELLGQSPRLFQGPETDRATLDRVRQALLQGEPVESETINYRKDGAPYLLRWSIAPVVNAEGERTHWVSVQRDVTDRRAMEENLRQERDLLSTVMQTSVVAILIVDGAGHVSFSNSRAEEILGLDRTALRTRRFDDPAWDARDLDGRPLEPDASPLRRVMQSGAPVEHVTYSVQPGDDRERRILSVSAAPVMTPGAAGGDGHTDGHAGEYADGHAANGAPGCIERVVVTFDDVTEDQAQRQRLYVQQTALDQAKEAIILLEAQPEGVKTGRRIRYVNRAFEDMTGFAASEVIGESLQMLKGPQTDPDVLTRIRQAYAEQVAVQEQLLNYRKDGSSFWAEVAIAPVFDADGVLRHWISIQRDITERKKTEAALRESTSYARRLIANMWDGFSVVSPDGAQVQVNDALCRMTGFDEAGLVNQRPPYPYWPPEYETELRTVHRAMIEGHTDVDAFETVFRRKSGERFPVQIHPAVLRGEDGRIVYGFATIRDISVRKEYEQGLVQAKEQAERARQEAERMNRMKTTLLTNMSHEIRTPLTSIIGFAEVLEAEDTLTDPAQRFTRLIRESSLRLLETLNSVLDLAQLESGSMRLHEEPVDVSREVRQVIRELEDRAASSRVDLRWYLGSSPVRAHTDRVAIGRIARNLIGNAIKFTPAGGRVDVQLQAKEDDGGGVFCLRVKDTGIGIAEDFLPNLFKTFHQESTGTAREYGGSGLGLAITQRLVHLAGGCIDVESVKGEGTTFRVEIPL